MTRSTAHGHNWPAMLTERAWMGVAHFNRPLASLAEAAILLLIFLLAGCATSTAGSSPMSARAEIPAPPPATSGYPAVEDLPSMRRMMTADEQAKLKKELIAARDHQASSAKAPGKSTGPKRTHQAAQPTKQAVRP